jgi:hypothetical protein
MPSEQKSSCLQEELHKGKPEPDNKDKKTDKPVNEEH